MMTNLHSSRSPEVGSSKNSSSNSSDSTTLSSSASTSTSTSSSQETTSSSSQHSTSNRSSTSSNTSAPEAPEDLHQIEHMPVYKEPPIVSSEQSVKRYRNSPFGLTRHYLTMPDPSEQPNDTLDDEEEDDDDDEDNDIDIDSNLGAAPIGQSQVVAKISGGHKSVASDQSCNLDLTSPNNRTNHACDLSVLASSGSNSLANWPEEQVRHHRHHKHHHHHHHRRHNRHNNLHHLPLHHHPSSQTKLSALVVDPLEQHNYTNGVASNGVGGVDRVNAIISPAGDAGLDAKKCNAAKAADAETADCFCDATNNLDLHQARKLKLEKLASKADDSSGLLVRFSSIIYATFLVILGCILHVSELRQKSKNSTDHIYTIIVALIGIIWLLFIQTDLQRYKKHASKYILIESIFNDSRQKQRDQNLSNDPTARSTTSSAASLVNDRMSMNTEVIFKKTAYKMYQHRAALDHHKGNRNYLDHHHHHHHHGSDMYKNPNVISQSSKDSSGGVSELSATHSDGQVNLVPAYKFLHGKMGANFYLKCGMAAFCFGHVIHEGLRFGQQLYFFGTNNTHCRDSAALVAHLITPLYSFYQLFMMFKYSNLVINRHKVLARFGLMHIIGTSVTFWFRTILEEAFEDFVHKMDYFKTNKPQMNLSLSKPSAEESSLVALFSSLANAIKSEANERSDWSFSAPDQNMTKAQSLITLMSSPITSTITPQMVRHIPESYACAQNTLLTTKSMNALPYLYPFTIEYNLLLAATFLSLYFNIGKVGLAAGETCKPFLFNSNSSTSYSNMMPKDSAHHHSSPGSQLESSDTASAIRAREGLEKEMGEYKSNFVVNADCHSANKGLFCGFFVLLVTLVTIVIFFVTINKPTHIQLGIKINLIQEATLTALILIVTLAGFKQVVKLNRNPYLKDKVTTDDVLMLIPLPFFFIHSLLSFRAETASMSSNSLSTYFPSISSASSSSSLNHHGNHHNSLTSPNGSPQSILLSTTNNSNNNSTQIESRSRLNKLLASHSNGTNGRFVEDFISSNNSVGNSINSGNRNGRNISSSSGGGGSSSSSSGGGIGFSSGSNNISGNNSSQIDHFKLITVALNIIVMIEVLVQTNFIIDGMRRCSESRYLRFKKPGRELITFAILLNITYWIVATFETKSVEQYKTEIEYYGPLPYMFISHTTLPVMLFYRYHSSVCLAEMWNRAYKPPKKR